MFTTAAPKSKDNVINVTVDAVKVSRGHWTRPSGSGKHSDRRTKRSRTRGAAVRRALAD